MNNGCYEIQLHIAVVDCRIDLKSDLCVNTNLIYEEWKLVYVCNIMSYKKYLKQNSIIEQNIHTGSKIYSVIVVETGT